MVCVGGGISGEDGEAARAGAVGMILANYEISRNENLAIPFVLPASNVNFKDGTYILDYIIRTK